MRRILYILPGPVPPEANKEKNKFSFLSEQLEGDILLPIWFKTPAEVESHLGSFPEFRMGRFLFHLFLSERYLSPLRPVLSFLFYLVKGLQLYFHKDHYEMIISYGMTRTGIAATILSLLTRTPLIIEVAGVPEHAYTYDSVLPTRTNRVKQLLTNFAIRIVTARASRFKLLYPNQLDGFSYTKSRPKSVFHDFVAVHSIGSSTRDENYFLFVGGWWYVKGVDILIKAFQEISPQIPAYKLKIIGYTPNREFFLNLAAGWPKIEFFPGIPNEEALKFMADCTVFVLPSRTEGMGRVLLEAMASRKPIIASSVDGIPHYLQDGDTALLFKNENVHELAQKMLTLALDPQLRCALATNGFQHVHQHLNERQYAREFFQMVQAASQHSLLSITQR